MYQQIIVWSKLRGGLRQFYCVKNLYSEKYITIFGFNHALDLKVQKDQLKSILDNEIFQFDLEDTQNESQACQAYR